MQIVESVPTLAKSNPVFAQWFGDDERDYAESLFHTANNMAEEAQASGKKADLSPENVAKVLETHLATKKARLLPPQPEQKRAPILKPTVNKTPIAEEPNRNNRLTEAEILRRATKAAFGSE